MPLKWNVRCIFMYYALYYFFNSDKLEIITDKNIPIVHLFHSFLFGFFIFNFLFFGRDRRYVLR